LSRCRLIPWYDEGGKMQLISWLGRSLGAVLRPRN